MKKKLMITGIIAFSILTYILVMLSTAQDDTDNNEKVFTVESIPEKAELKDVKMDNGELSFTVVNVTQDNPLVSFELEYVRLIDGEEGISFIAMSTGPKSGLLPIQSSESSTLKHKTTFALGRDGIFRFTSLNFEDKKDDYVGKNSKYNKAMQENLTLY